MLDVAAALGSDWALGIQEAAGVPEEYPDYSERMTALRYLVVERPVADWGSTVYDAWLYAILPLWQPHGADFPDYMQTNAWAARAHQAGFGSYAELKHDTVLYSKQAFAEGDAPLPPAPPRHWVEPDPIPFERLAEAARLLRTGLADRGLLPAETADLLDGLIDMEGRFGRIARDELAGIPLSAADNDWLASIGTTFELLWLQAGEAQPEDGATGGIAQDPEGQAPVVVDIMSNPSGRPGDRHRGLRHHLRPGPQRRGAVPGGHRGRLRLLRVLGAARGAPHRRGVAPDAGRRRGAGPPCLALPPSTAEPARRHPVPATGPLRPSPGRSW